MIRIKLIGTNQATGCGHTVKARGYGGPIGKLARLLVADGYAEHDLVDIRRNGTQCFVLSPLSYWAKYDWTEGEDFSCRRVKHKPFSADVWDK